MLNLITLILYLSAAWGASAIQVDCKIFDENGVLIKKFPGNRCVFRDNGDRVEIDLDKITYLDSSDNPIWSRPGYYHHQTRFDEANNQIVFLGETFHDIYGVKTRFDSVVLIDIKTGKEKKTLDFHDYFKKRIFDIDREYPFLQRKMWRVVDAVKFETTHVNSISQIPPNPSARFNEAFKEGNWILNLSFTGTVVIFDKDFQNIIWQKKIKLLDTNFHDVQVTPQGKIVIYLNSYLETTGAKISPASIAVVDPLVGGDSGIQIFQMKNDGKFFTQPVSGGIQFLPGDMKLASIYGYTAGFQVGFLDKNWNVVKKFTPHPSASGKYGQNFQEAKLVDLGKFLKNYKGQF